MTFPRVILPELPKPRVTTVAVKTVGSVTRLQSLTKPVSKFQQNLSNLSSTGFVGTLPPSTAITYTKNVLGQSVKEIGTTVQQTLTNFAKAATGAVTTVKKVSSEIFSVLSKSSTSIGTRIEEQIDGISKITTGQNDLVQLNGFLLTPATQKSSTLKPSELKQLTNGSPLVDSLVQKTIDHTVAGVISTRFNPRGLTTQLQSLNKLST